MTEKIFIEKYPEFKDALIETDTENWMYNYLLPKKVEEILDKHFVRKEDYDESIKDFEILSKGSFKDVTECKKNHIEKQKVKDAIEEHCNITLIGGRSLRDVLKKRLGLEDD